MPIIRTANNYTVSHMWMKIDIINTFTLQGINLLDIEMYVKCTKNMKCSNGENVTKLYFLLRYEWAVTL
jgi:hypothetical protein